MPKYEHDNLGNYKMYYGLFDMTIKEIRQPLS